MTRIEFFVHGKSQPQGSMNGWARGGFVSITSANKKLKPWRGVVELVAGQAVEEWRNSNPHDQTASEPLFGKHIPVTLILLFTFRKPESVSKKRTHCVVKPDLDKLTRAIGDALTGIVWHDDSQVIGIHAAKVYGPVEGCRITVESADDVIAAVKDCAK